MAEAPMTHKKNTAIKGRGRAVFLRCLFSELVTRECGVRCTRSPLFVFGQRESHDVIDFRSAVAIAESLDVNEDPFAASQRSNEAVPFVVIPGCDFSFAAHIRPQRRRQIRRYSRSQSDLPIVVL